MKHLRERFLLAYVIVGLVAFLAVVGTAAALRGQLPNPRFSHSDPAPACMAVSCARLGDEVTYVLHGKVTAVQVPQPGVICVQVASAKSGGDYCALAK